MTVKIINRTNKNVITVNNVKDITHYNHDVKGHVMVLSDVNHGTNTLVSLNEYELLSVSN